MDDIQQILIHKNDHTYIKVEAAKRDMNMRDFVALLVETFKLYPYVLNKQAGQEAFPEPKMVSED